MPIEIPGIDTEIALGLFDDDLEIYKVVLRAFVSNIPEVLDKIRGVSSETLQDYLIKIHSLKGSCANIGAEKARAEAGRLELMAKNGDLTGVQDGNGSFLEKITVLMDDIRNWLEQTDSN
jgi:HPt (histidine-containing phosphotransfer) domain-containing protein